MKKLVAMLLALMMCVGLFAGCANTTSDSSESPSSGTTGEGVSYTYRDYSEALGTNWNSHTWETNADNAIMSYITTQMVTMMPLDTENGVYQWVYEMATSVTDVTADHQDDLTNYGVTLPEGTNPEDVTEGYVYEVTLNPDAAWQDGTPINADTYIYSMQQLLNPDMKNYRANLVYSGEGALAGANAYYYSGDTVWQDAAGAYALADLVLGDDGVYTTADGTPLYIGTQTALSWLGGETLDTYVTSYGEQYFGVEDYQALVALAAEDGTVPLTEESLALLQGVITAVADWGESAEDACNYLVTSITYEEVPFEGTVGLIKVDDYTLRYVTQAYIDLNNFMTFLGDGYLVYEETYEAGKDTTGTLVTTDYGTSPENTMSFGPYILESYQADRQMVFTRNENWYGWEDERNDEGNLVSYTPYEVDGENVERWQATSIVIDVMDDNTAMQAFLSGDLSSWRPTAEELPNYTTSTQLFQQQESYTMSFFFNTDVAALQTMDTSGGNTNSVVLSNENFRRAMSLAINRDEYVTATPGYVAAYSLMNDMYYYDPYNDPTSNYRHSDAAMQAICNLYGVEYGEGTPYATLEDAYNSINGYNLTEAQALMAQACDELVEAGLYTEGEDIYIRIAWAAGSLSDPDNNQVALLNEMVNAALEGSGFGTLTFEAVGNLENRYADVPAGTYAIGYGAWGGAYFYPFRNMQVYCDPDQYDVNEMGCWDPTTETLTLNINGEDVTMTWQEWSNCMIGAGAYATADNETKLQITALLEEEYLNKFYRIPLCGTTICELLSYQVRYITENYNVMYGFGGLELLQFQYSDAEWEEFVSSEGGTLSYE